VNLLLLLLEKGPEPDKGGPDIGAIMAPILSGLAFILSSAAFVFTVFIQIKERKRNIRQTLSVALSQIASINVEVSTIKKDEREVTPQTLDIRKNYNSQRGTLVSDADFLIRQNEKIVTDADCELMALTYADLNDNEKSEEYWLQAIKLARNPVQQHLHQRNYASFLFNRNDVEKGRLLFEKSLSSGITHTDDYLVNLSDTYVTWARLEQNFGNESEFGRLINQAKSHCKEIQHRHKKEQISKLIDHASGDNK